MHMIERMKDHEHFFLALFFYTILQWILRWTRHNRIELTEPSFRTVRLKCWYAWMNMPRTSFINWIIRRSFLFKLMELFAIDTMAAIVFGIKHLNKYDETLCRVSVSFTSQDGKKKTNNFSVDKIQIKRIAHISQYHLQTVYLFGLWNSAIAGLRLHLAYHFRL